MVVYFDNILIFSKNEGEHLVHLRSVLEALRPNKLFLNLKCDFLTNQLVFLGFVINSQGLTEDQKKVQAILYWPIPTNLHELGNFHRFATFYRRFIKHYNTHKPPITNCMKNAREF